MTAAAIAFLLGAAWGALGFYAVRTEVHRPSTPPPARPAGSENHPAGRGTRRGGCPDSITVDADGRLHEVWI